MSLSLREESTLGNELDCPFQATGKEFLCLLASFRPTPIRALFVGLGETWSINTTGPAGLSEATIELHDGRLAGGKAVVDMNSIICQDIEDSKLTKVLIDHLRTDDFFLVDRFPTATFVLDSAQTIENATPGSPN